MTAKIFREKTLFDIGLMSGAEQYENFANLKNIVSATELEPSSRPYTFPEGERIELPETYNHEGQQLSLAKLLDDTRTGALLVLKDGKIVFENYWRTGGLDVQWISMSVAKSFVSAMIGMCLADGKIDNLSDPVEKYLPGMVGGGYEGVAIENVLRMASGTDFVESYEDGGDPESAMAKMAASMALNRYREFVAALPRRWEPGTLSQYNSCDTSVLGWIVEAASGKSLTEFMQERISEPLGIEYPGYWLVDNNGDEFAAGGLNLVARDFAKFGELYRNGGVWMGKQIVPADYVKESVRVAGPQFAPGAPVVGHHNFPAGYGYQWWLPAGNDGEFSAIGIYNQFIYINPRVGTVIVKSSANPRYGLSIDDSDNKDVENISALKAINAVFA